MACLLALGNEAAVWKRFKSLKWMFVISNVSVIET